MRSVARRPFPVGLVLAALLFSGIRTGAAASTPTYCRVGCRLSKVACVGGAKRRLATDEAACASVPDPAGCRADALASFRRSRDACRRVARDDCLACCTRANGPDRFADGFESPPKGSQASSRRSGWTSLQMQAGGSLDLSATAHAGAQGLRVHCPPEAQADAVPKAAVIHGGLGFRKHAHVWTHFWLLLADSVDNSGFYFCDIEDPTLPKSPGRRLKLRGSYPNYLGSDLAKVVNPTVEGESKVGFPRNRWVEVLWHLYLSDDPDEGVVQIWQDRAVVLDTNAQTLPVAASTYANVSLGCTANSNADDAVAAAFDGFAIWGTCAPASAAFTSERDPSR